MNIKPIKTKVDYRSALKEIEHFAQMGQSIDLVATSPDFASLVKSL